MKKAYSILEEPIGKKLVITYKVDKQLVPASG